MQDKLRGQAVAFPFLLMIRTGCGMILVLRKMIRGAFIYVTIVLIEIFKDAWVTKKKGVITGINWNSSSYDVIS